MKSPCKGCTAGCVALPNELQPYGVELYTADGVMIKEMHIPKLGTLVPQHSHVYDHTTMVAAGSVSIQREGMLEYSVSAPAGIFIPANEKHSFLSLEDDTILYCIHNISHTGEIEIAEEHQIVGA
jgi:quercetin dioxygenase-like cupin family protein